MTRQSATNRKPAIQGGFDYAHSAGFYLGNWNSNVDSAFANGSNIEMDFYGGYKSAMAAFGFDVGVLNYYYPGTGKPAANTTELYGRRQLGVR